MSNTVKYQPHIDGLRAIAVMAVLLFHADPSWLPGGFVGVDVFFVISGFLITSIITREISQNTFTLASFYKRRIKRILPVYFSVAASVLIVGWLLLFPDDLQDLAKSTIASTFFVSNYYFYATSGYFASAAELKPLLHTWSLAVEEQFYIFWPLVLAALAAWVSTRWRNVIILSGFLLSLIASVILSKSHPDFAYYSIITRTFELMVGAMAAIYLPYVKRVPNAAVIAFAGGMLASLIVFDKNMLFPGFIALIPCVATALLIAKGAEIGVVNGVLSSRVMVAVGLLSYSLYMWHWPVLAFMRYYYIDLTLMHTGAAMAIIFGLAYLSRRFIEKPFLTAKTTFRQAAVVGFLAPVAVIGAVSYLFIATQGVPERYSQQEQAFIQSFSANPHHCQRIVPYDGVNNDCVVTSNDYRDGIGLRVLVWGDSHANHLWGAMQRMAEIAPYEMELVTFSGCPAIRGVYRINRTYSEACFKHNQAVWESLVLSGDYDVVLMASNWANYPRGDNLADQADKTKSVENSARAMYSNLASQWQAMQSQGIPMVVFDSVPNFPQDPARCNLNKRLFEQSRSCNVERAQIEQKKAVFNDFMNDQERRLSNLHVADGLSVLCDSDTCYSARDGVAIYSDKNHLSFQGSVMIADKLVEAIQRAHTNKDRSLSTE